MGYLLKKNGSLYAVLSKTNKIKTTQDPSEATVFSEEEAKVLLQKATKKLKGYALYELSDKNGDMKEALSSKTKRRSFSAEERIYVYNKYQGHCGICGDFVPMDAFTVDHIKPLSKGGTYEKENLQCACRSCNLMKQDILPDDMMEKIIKILDYQVGRKTSGKKHKKIKKHLKKVRGIVLS